MQDAGYSTEVINNAMMVAHTVNEVLCFDSSVAVERARVRLKWSFKVLSHFGSRATL